MPRPRIPRKKRRVRARARLTRSATNAPCVIARVSWAPGHGRVHSYIVLPLHSLTPLRLTARPAFLSPPLRVATRSFGHGAHLQGLRCGGRFAAMRLQLHSCRARGAAAPGLPSLHLLRPRAPGRHLGDAGRAQQRRRPFARASAAPRETNLNESDTPRPALRVAGPEAFKAQDLEVFHVALARLGEVTADTAELEALADAMPDCALGRPPRKRPAASAPQPERSRSRSRSSSLTSSAHSRSDPCIAEAREPSS